MTDNEINLLFANLIADREQAIARLMDEDHELDRMSASIEWDAHRAPFTTNREQLEMIGVDPTFASLKEIIHGLSKWNIYLTETNHLTREELSDHLLNRVLADKVRMIPPTNEVSEFIDLAGVKGSDPDYNADRDDFLPRPAREEVGIKITTIH